MQQRYVFISPFKLSQLPFSLSIANYRPTLKTKYGLNETFLNMTFGIYSYEILDCEKSSGKCELVEDYLDNAECISYPPDWEPDGFMQASRTFHILASLVSSLVVFMLTISMCFILSRRTWKAITAFLLITGMCSQFWYARYSRGGT